MNNKYSLDEYVNIINNYLETSIDDCNFGEDIVHEAMRYSLGIGGKRIRPVLAVPVSIPYIIKNCSST